jgi:hypothetical protein
VTAYCSPDFIKPQHPSAEACASNPEIESVTRRLAANDIEPTAETTLLLQTTHVESDKPEPGDQVGVIDSIGASADEFASVKTSGKSARD